MTYKEYKRYLTDHEYINLKAMRIALGRIRKKLDENKLLLYEHEQKLKERSEFECHLYHSDMYIILGKERKMLKNTREKIEHLIDSIVKKAIRRCENIKYYEEHKNEIKNVIGNSKK